MPNGSQGEIARCARHCVIASQARRRSPKINFVLTELTVGFHLRWFPKRFFTIYYRWLQNVTAASPSHFQSMPYSARLSKFVTICARASHRCACARLVHAACNRMEFLTLCRWLLGVINQRGVITHRFCFFSEHTYLFFS